MNFDWKYQESSYEKLNSNLFLVAIIVGHGIPNVVYGAICHVYDKKKILKIF